VAAPPIDTTKQCPSCNVSEGYIHMPYCATQIGRYRPVVHQNDVVEEHLAAADRLKRFIGGHAPPKFETVYATSEDVIRQHYAEQAAPVTAFDTGRYPDDNPKTIHGLSKPSISLVPPVALVEMARAFRHGADKYGPANWRDKPVTIQTYLDAALRHLLSIADGEDVDPESGCLHAAHVASCMAIIMDASASGTLQDRRPTPGKAGELIRKYTAAL